MDSSRALHKLAQCLDRESQIRTSVCEEIELPDDSPVQGWIRVSITIGDTECAEAVGYILVYSSACQHHAAVPV